VRGKRELPELIAPTRYPCLSLIPADFSYRNLDVRLSERRHPTERLMLMTRSLHDAIDLLFLDCPPGMTVLTENVLRAADALVVPVVPFFSMVDRRKSLHDAVITNARNHHPEILATEIPYWSDIERMTVRRAPLPAFAPASPAAGLYASLWKEIVGRMDVKLS
jgi:cellulose biosynthesis protein BcsQ